MAKHMRVQHTFITFTKKHKYIIRNIYNKQFTDIIIIICKD